MFKKKKIKEPVEKKKARTPFLVKQKKKFVAYREDLKDRYEEEKGYFASEEERDPKVQQERDQYFLKKLLQSAGIAVVLIVLYKLVLRQ